MTTETNRNGVTDKMLNFLTPSVDGWDRGDIFTHLSTSTFALAVTVIIGAHIGASVYAIVAFAAGVHAIQLLTAYRWYKLER